jgi:hypothetical protein
LGVKKFTALDIIRITNHHLTPLQQATVVQYFETLGRRARARGKKTSKTMSFDLRLEVVETKPIETVPTVNEEALIEDFFIFDLLLKGKTKDIFDALAGRKTFEETLQLVAKILRDIVP